MRELQIAVAAAHSDYLVAIQASNDAPLDRAGRAARRLAAAFPDSPARDATALALEAYAEFGERHQALIEELGFDTALPSEARTLAAGLRERLRPPSKSGAAAQSGGNGGAGRGIGVEAFARGGAARRGQLRTPA
jgi:hypothetical protein